MDTDILNICRNAAQRHADKSTQRRAKQASRKRIRYAEYRANGWCIECGMDSGGYCYCAECRLYKNQLRSGAQQAPRSPKRKASR